MRPSIFLFLLIAPAVYLSSEINMGSYSVIIACSGMIALSIAYWFIQSKEKHHFYSSFFTVLGLFIVFFSYGNCFFNFYASDDIYHIREKILGFEGVVITDIDTKVSRSKKSKYQEYGIRVNYAFVKNKKISADGRVLVKSTMLIYQLSPGDRVQVAGYINRTDSMKPIGGFNYGKFLRRQGYTHFVWVKNDKSQRIDEPDNTIRRMGAEIKSFISSIIGSALENNIHAKNFVSALLLGTRSTLENRIQEDFRHTGVYHVLALSGLHIGLLFAFIFFFLSFLGIKRKNSFISTGLILIVFTIVVGFIHSLVRALVMALCVIFAKILERDRDYINSLFLAGFIIILMEPGSIFSVSFQLSFGATFGILTLFQPIHEMFQKSRLPFWITSSLAVTISAQVFIFPLLLYYFGVFYLVSFIANLICVPLVSFIAFTSIMGIITTFIPYIGKAYLLLAEFITDLLFHLIKFFSFAEDAALRWKMPLYAVITYYIVSFAIWLYIRKIKVEPKKNNCIISEN